MRIQAFVSNNSDGHQVEVATDGKRQSIAIGAKGAGRGSSLNGGELLFAAMATCFCNDLFREAGKRDIEVNKVEVEVTGEFGGPGDPARNVCYKVRVEAAAPELRVEELIRATDAVAEIQNTVRRGCPVELVSAEVVRSAQNPQ